MSFATRLKELRIRRNISQSECAQELGISHRAYQTYEQGEREPKYSVCKQMCQYFGVTLDYLLDFNYVPDTIDKQETLRRLQIEIELLTESELQELLLFTEYLIHKRISK